MLKIDGYLDIPDDKVDKFIDEFIDLVEAHNTFFCGIWRSGEAAEQAAQGELLPCAACGGILSHDGINCAKCGMLLPQSP